MRIRVEITSGARRGLRRTFEGPRVSVGRHPDCDLQLDPEVDRAASARHAVFLLAGGRWIVRDVGSRNGTFVDDDPVEGERRLRDGDVVQFGRQGPRARVEVLTSETREFEEAGAGAGAAAAAGSGGSGGDGGGGSSGSASSSGGSRDARDPGDTTRTPAAGSSSSGGSSSSAGSSSSGGGSGGSGGGGGSSGGGSDRGGSTTDRLRQQVERRGMGLVVLAVVLAALLGAGAAWFFLGGPGGSGGSDGPADGPVGAAGGSAPAASSERTDSVLRSTRQTLDSLRGRVSGLQEALEDSRARVAEIQQQLRQARDAAPGSDGGGAAERRELERRLDSALTELQRQSALATTDFSGVESGQWRALAQIYVETAGGEVSTATAFAVRAEGLLVTSRHTVLEEDGSPAARIGAQFARSDQVWPAELLATHDEADLALLRVRNVQGGVPVITTLGDGTATVAEGSPVAVLGYSGGRQAPAAGESGRLPRPSLSVGLLTERGEDQLRVRGFGDRGGSGSPIFDTEGRLVGVLRGGVDDGSPDGRRMLVAVPARVVRSLVDTVLERLAG